MLLSRPVSLSDDLAEPVARLVEGPAPASTSTAPDSEASGLRISWAMLAAMRPRLARRSACAHARLHGADARQIFAGGDRGRYGGHRRPARREKVMSDGNHLAVRPPQARLPPRARTGLGLDLGLDAARARHCRRTPSTAARWPATADTPVICSAARLKRGHAVLSIHRDDAPSPPSGRSGR